MNWLRIDDKFVEHEKVEPLSDRAFRLHVAALCLCSRNLTDGKITLKACKVLCALVGATRKHVAEIVEAGLWLVDDDGHSVKDYLEYNPTARQVKQQRSRNARRQQELRGRRSDVAGDVEASLSNGESNALRNGPRHALRVVVGNGECNAAPIPTPVLNPLSQIPFPAFVARFEGGELLREIGVGQVLQACRLERDIDARVKVERASKGCSEADFVAAIEACSGPGVRDRLAVALATLKKRRTVA